MSHSCPDWGHDHDRRPTRPAYSRSSGKLSRRQREVLPQRPPQQARVLAEGRNGAPYAI